MAETNQLNENMLTNSIVSQGGRDNARLAYHQSEWQNEQVRDLLAAIGRGELATEKTGAAGILQAQLIAGNLGVQAEKIGAAGQLAIEKTAAATLLDIEKTHSASLLAQTTHANAAALAAAFNHNDIKAALAECCCELKELIRAENGATRQLMQSDRIRQLELQVAQLQGCGNGGPGQGN